MQAAFTENQEQQQHVQYEEKVMQQCALDNRLEGRL